MNWKFYLKFIIPLIRQAGEEKKAEDENKTGKDDMIGAALVFAADLLEAILKDKPLPKAPPELK